MKRINQSIEKVECWLCSVMLVAIVLLVFISAVTRYIGFPIVWSVDASQLAFVWICMLGADYAQRHFAHMGVDIITRKFPQKIQKILRFFSNILSIGFLIFITYWGVILCFKNYMRSYSTLGISFSWATAAIPFGAVLMIFSIAGQTFELFKSSTDSEEQTTSVSNEEVSC